MIRSWRAAPAIPVAAKELARVLDLHPQAVSVLWQRGLRDQASILRFLDPTPPDPRLLPGMAAAVDELQRAVERREEIAVYGDYDVDGLSSTAILVWALRQVGASVRYRIPHRLREGYGLRSEALMELARDGVKLVVTVDNGITAAAEVAVAQELGLRILVTDHHQPTSELPATPILNPRLGGWPTGTEELAGAGVAYQLVAAWLGPEAARQVADLAMLGTVADVVALVGENRRLVQAGLARLRSDPRPGLRALCHAAGLEPAVIGEEEVAFYLAPRLNALGRLGSAEEGVELLLGTQPEAIAALARQVEQANLERRRIEEEVLAAAEEQLAGEVRPAVLVAAEGWHRGVLGLVAGRLSERYRRSAFAVTIEGGVAHGSGRGPGRPSLAQVLAGAAPLLDRFGGHAAAVGFSLSPDRLGELTAYLETACAGDLAAEPELRAEIALEPAQLDTELLKSLDRLAPFGSGHPAPLIELAEVRWQGAQRFGSGRHLRVRLPAGVEGVLFRAPTGLESDWPYSLDLLGHARCEVYRGQRRRRLLIRGVAAPGSERLGLGWRRSPPAEIGSVVDARGADRWATLAAAPGPLRILAVGDDLDTLAKARADLLPASADGPEPAGLIFWRRPLDSGEFWWWRRRFPAATIYLLYHPADEAKLRAAEAERHPDRERLLDIWRNWSSSGDLPEALRRTGRRIFIEIGLLRASGTGWELQSPRERLELGRSPTFRKAESYRDLLLAEADAWYHLPEPDLHEWLRGTNSGGFEGEAPDGTRFSEAGN